MCVAGGGVSVSHTEEERGWKRIILYHTPASHGGLDHQVGRPARRKENPTASSAEDGVHSLLVAGVATATVVATVVTRSLDSVWRSGREEQGNTA